MVLIAHLTAQELPLGMLMFLGGLAVGLILVGASRWRRS
jgi:hypothetical protein